MIASLGERETCCDSSEEESLQQKQKADCEKRVSNYKRLVGSACVLVIVSRRPTFHDTTIPIQHNRRVTDNYHFAVKT